MIAESGPAYVAVPLTTTVCAVVYLGEPVVYPVE
jgi:hypothetical protein